MLHGLQRPEVHGLPGPAVVGRALPAASGRLQHRLRARLPAQGCAPHRVLPEGLPDRGLDREPQGQVPAPHGLGAPEAGARRWQALLGGRGVWWLRQGLLPRGLVPLQRGVDRASVPRSKGGQFAQVRPARGGPRGRGPLPLRVPHGLRRSAGPRVVRRGPHPLVLPVAGEEAPRRHLDEGRRWRRALPLHQGSRRPALHEEHRRGPLRSGHLGGPQHDGCGARRPH
mmetsp:Transcript_128487/g.399797  ORF Transcript_128487/g.399797 Transcript_128487/m.399797 type:complete len:227 (-) Transcript_128487:184-864(-)